MCNVRILVKWCCQITTVYYPQTRYQHAYIKEYVTTKCLVCPGGRKIVSDIKSGRHIPPRLCYLPSTTTYETELPELWRIYINNESFGVICNAVLFFLQLIPSRQAKDRRKGIPDLPSRMRCFSVSDAIGDMPRLQISSHEATTYRL